MSTDSSDIDNALVAMLSADATLLSYCPHGVHWDIAPENSKKFVIVSLVSEADEAVFGGRAIEDAIYRVKAVMQEKGGGNIKAAAARIDELLEDQELLIGSPPSALPGYTWMTLHREERIRATEVDDRDTSIRWQHRGGLYRLSMSLSDM